MSTVEEVSVARLLVAHQRLMLSSERTGVTRDDYAVMLDALAAAAEALGADMVPRVYRRNFTANYQRLFPCEGRHYRADILEASMKQCTAIWVNGELYGFNAEAICRAKALQQAWTTFKSLLDCCFHSPTWPSSSTIRDTIAAVDAAWASFEHEYISELIVIEEKARHLIVKAVEHEKRLQWLEGIYEGEESGALLSFPEYRKEQESLVWFVSRLNSVANVDGKGRDDLDVGVLGAALKTRQHCDAAEKAGESTEATAAARVLATNVIESFDAMRSYLRNVAKRLDCLDPHLHRNAGLVERLVNWEGSWEVGTEYFQNPQLLNSLCDMVAHIRQAQRLVPAFEAMFQSYDPEVFMILPRLIWLRFLTAPRQHSEFMQRLLLPAVAAYEELNALKRMFQSTKLALTASVPQRKGMSGEAKARDLLVQRAVLGTADLPEPHEAPPQRREPASEALQKFVHALEPWSIRLQRHCPEDWNQCIALIIGCLSTGNPAISHEAKVREGTGALPGTLLPAWHHPLIHSTSQTESG